MDFLLDDDGDLDFSTGDFRVGNNDLGHIESILLAQKGEFKQFPMMGIGIKDYINAPFTAKVRVKIEKETKLQLASDGFKNIYVKVGDEGSIDVNADRNE